jgi:hypothetical protein
MELKTAIKENQNKDHPNHKEKAQTVKDLLKLKEKDKRDKKERDLKMIYRMSPHHQLLH